MQLPFIQDKIMNEREMKLIGVIDFALECLLVRFPKLRSHEELGWVLYSNSTYAHREFQIWWNSQRI